MTKRKVYYVFHIVFWNVLAFLPMLVAIAYCLSGFKWFDTSSVTSTYYHSYIPEFIRAFRDTELYSIFLDFIRGTFGIFTSSANNHIAFLADTLTWLVFIELFHLLYDFIMFLPKVIYKFIERKILK